MINEKDILTSLEKVNYPGFSRDIISFGLVKSVTVDGNDVEVKIEIATKDPSIPQKIHNDSQEAISAISGVGTLDRFRLLRQTALTLLFRRLEVLVQGA